MASIPPPAAAADGAAEEEAHTGKRLHSEAGGGHEPSTKLKKLEKNRESARESRRKKKEYVLQLEEKVQALERDVQELREQREPHSVEELKRAMEVFTSNLAALVKQCESSEESEKQSAEQSVHMLLDQLATTVGEGLADTLDHHFDRAAGLMQPLPFAKFLLWGLDHDDSWFQEESDSSDHGIWGVMVQEMELTEAQQRQLISLREICATLRRDYIRLFGNIQDLKRDVRGQMLTVAALLTQLRLMFTPLQQAKYLVWTRRNPACMQLVNSLWKDVSPAPAPASLSSLLHPSLSSASLPALLEQARAGLEGAAAAVADPAAPGGSSAAAGGVGGLAGLGGVEGLAGVEGLGVEGLARLGDGL